MGKHEEPREPVAGDARAETSAAAVAVALGKAARSSDVNAKAAKFLVSQKRLVDVQLEHLHEERALHHRHLALQYFGDRLHVGLQLLAVAFGAIVLVGLGALAWQSHEDHGLVVEVFSVPPDLAARGLTGEVVASHLLDKLVDMQNQTASLRPANSYANNWGHDLKVEIPTTGVSIGELQRLLRTWLGHETHISGEVFRTAAGLAVSARTEGNAARTFEGPDADLSRLLSQTAEVVYGATQPYRYAIFLDQHGRGVEARPLLERLAETGSPIDRYSAAVYLSGEALIAGDSIGGVAMANVAIKAEPTAGRAYWYRGVHEFILGHWETSLGDYRKAVHLLSRFGDQFSDPQLRDRDLSDARQQTAEAEGNWLGAAVQGTEARASQAHLGRHELGGEDADEIAVQAWDMAQDHDATRARALVVGAGLPEAPGAGMGIGSAAVFRIRRERAAEDWPALIAEIPYVVGVRTPEAGDVARDLNDVTAFAYGLARSGRLAEAEAMEATTPLDCYPCVVDRGAIAAMRRDWPTAQRWFAQAARQAPSLSGAHLEWGRMLLAKGDVGGAILQLDLAHQKGPHFADPMELWGEALMRQRDHAGAAAKFAEANKDAPRWGRNHMLWGQALAALGERSEASAQFRAAKGMDLSAADRVTLQGLLKAA